MFKKLITILIYSYIIILIKYISLSINNNYIYKFTEDCPVILFIIIINSFFYIILIRNDSD